MEVTMLHDVSKCTGCRACTVACKQWKSLPADLTPFTGEFQSHPDLSPKTYTILRMAERVEEGKFHWDFLKFQCMHCDKAECVKVCPVHAMTKSDNGIISFDVDRCMGCGLCVRDCPFRVPKIDVETFRSSKCNFCEDRVLKGMEPACAKTCPVGALQFGGKDTITAMAEARVNELQKTNPLARVYGLTGDGVTGGHMIYVLENAPGVYGLPPGTRYYNPAPWVDSLYPLVKWALGGLAATVLGLIIYKRNEEKSKPELPAQIASGGEIAQAKKGGDGK